MLGFENGGFKSSLMACKLSNLKLMLIGGHVLRDTSCLETFAVAVFMYYESNSVYIT